MSGLALKTWKHFVIFERFDVVVVPFPFTDIDAKLRRPAVVLSDPVAFGKDTGQNLMAMVTRAQRSSWQSDLPIQDSTSAGLAACSLLRLKLFNIENRFIIRKLGQLSELDIFRLKSLLVSHLGLD